MVSSVRIGHSPFSQNKKNNLKGLRRVGPSHNSKMAVRNAKHIFQWKISVENLSRLSVYYENFLVGQAKFFFYLHCDRNFQNFGINGKQR